MNPIGSDKYFLKLIHYEQLGSTFVNNPHVNKTKILKDWAMNYLHHLYEIECDRIMLKFHKSDENVAKAIDVLPPLHRIGELICFWKQIQHNNNNDDDVLKSFISEVF